MVLMAKIRQMISVSPRGGGEVHAAELLDPSGRTACGENYAGWVVAPGVSVQVPGRKHRQIVPAAPTCERCKRAAFKAVSDEAVSEHRAARGKKRGRGKR
jgi:hypothetical protein